jgi:hypothetical protein
MSVVRFGLVSGLVALVAAAAGLLACSSAEDERDGSSEAAIVQDRVVTVGRCRAPFYLDPSDALPPADQVTPHRLRGISRDAVLTAADISVTVRTVRGKRQIALLDARVARDFGFSRGAAGVLVAEASSQATSLQTSQGQVDYQARMLVSSPTGTVGALQWNDAPATPLGVAVLHREPRTGRGWLLLGTREDDLAAVASNCTFDERAWSLLADPACEGVLFDGADAGPSSCGGPAKDAGADASVDAGAAPDAGPDASADAGATASPDAATSTAAKAGPEGEDPPSTDDGAERTPITSAPPQDEDVPAPTKRSASTGCSASPASGGTGVPAGLGLGLATVGLAALGASRARRRLARRA